MHFVGLVAALCLALPLYASGESRAKRFAAFGSLSTVGGRVGCVVSQNKLFINGHFTKDLSDDEQQELKQYADQLTQFKADVKAYLEERQKEFRSQVGRGQQQQDSETKNAAAQPKKPEPPKKPSFCSDKATTQYVFDGCSVQGDNVFIGDTFVRKLSPAELQELQAFDQQFTAYQKVVTAGFRKRVEEMFGSHFGSLFGAGDSSPAIGGGAALGAGSSPASPPASGGGSAETGAKAGGSADPQPEAPKTPSFCTLIV